MVIDLTYAQSDFDGLPVVVKARVRDVMLRLEQWPNVSGVKALRGSLSGHYRIRTGDYRVIFRVDGDVVTLVRIGHRSEIYEE